MTVCVLALMVFIPSHSVPISGQICGPSGYTRAWRELLEPASIAKNDTRYGLHQGGPTFGLNGNETEWLANATGSLICPGSEGLMGRRGSAALIERNDLILTNVHLVRNKDGSLRQDWSKCYFETHSRPPVKRMLKLFDQATVFGTRDTVNNSALDYAFIRLEQPIPGVQPIKISEDVKTIEVGQPLFMVSARQERMKKNRQVKPNEPIIQRFNVQELESSKGNGSRVIFSDASGTHGASGSILLMRDAANQLVGVGIHVRGADQEFDGLPYEKGAIAGNRSFQILADGPFLSDLKASLKFQSGL